MSKTAYRILSTDALVKYRAEISETTEVGGTVSLDIPKDEEVAVIAAGWIEHATKPAKEKE